MLPARGSPYWARMSAICWSAVLICVILHQRSALLSEPCSCFVLTSGTADRPGATQCVRSEILNLGCVQSLSSGAQQHRSLGGLFGCPAERDQAVLGVSAHLIPPRGRKLPKLCWVSALRISAITASTASAPSSVRLSSPTSAASADI